MSVVVENMTELQGWLKGLWRARGYSSPSAFAAAVGVSPSSYFNWTDRGVRPKRAQVIQIAEFVEVDPDWALALAGYGSNAEVEEPNKQYDERPRNAEDDRIRGELSELLAKIRKDLDEFEGRLS